MPAFRLGACWELLVALQRSTPGTAGSAALSLQSIRCLCSPTAWCVCV